MKAITLLPADIYTVVNKTILNSNDLNNIISLYEPIIGHLAVSLYFTFLRDLDKLEIMSIDYTHHHLMTVLKCDLDNIKSARECLEAVGLLKSYVKVGDVNNYVYEVYSPISPYEFFNHPILNVVLYNNIGKLEYDLLKKLYKDNKFDLKEYEDISMTLDAKYLSSNGMINEFDNTDIKDFEKLSLDFKKGLDFDLIISSLPKGLINDKTFNKKVKELLNNLAFVYNLDSLKMVEIIRTVINENGVIDKENIRKSARNYYQYNNNGQLPTLIYRSQPEYLKSPQGNNTNKGKILYIFENISPYDFLKSKYKGSQITLRDKRLLETLVVDLELKPAVVNVLIDYVLRINNNKLNQAYVETIAGQWKRIGIDTAKEAMDIAEKEHKKINKKLDNIKPLKETIKPVWFNENIETEESSDTEIKEMEELLKEFR